LSRKSTVTPLGGILQALRRYYGKPEPPAVTDPFALILLENVAYLASDSRKAEAFRLLKKLTGLKPERILAASPAALHEIGGKGIMPGNTVGSSTRSRRPRSRSTAATSPAFSGVLPKRPSRP
jgi:hypothetical protein